MSENGIAARAYAERGWHVFPLAEGSKLPKIARAAGGHGFKDATAILDQIDAWVVRWPRANVGIRTGATSGLFVLDVDVRHRGDASLDRLIAKHGELPPTLTAKTPSGGWHHYFVWPGVELRNSCRPARRRARHESRRRIRRRASSIIPLVGVVLMGRRKFSGGTDALVAREAAPQA